jgi:hypothetical protein
MLVPYWVKEWWDDLLDEFRHIPVLVKREFRLGFWHGLGSIVAVMLLFTIVFPSIYYWKLIVGVSRSMYLDIKRVAQSYNRLGCLTGRHKWAYVPAYGVTMCLYCHRDKPKKEKK